jgi:hypothetical protein
MSKNLPSVKSSFQSCKIRRNLGFLPFSRCKHPHPQEPHGAYDGKREAGAGWVPFLTALSPLQGDFGRGPLANMVGTSVARPVCGEPSHRHNFGGAASPIFGHRRLCFGCRSGFTAELPVNNDS